MEQEYIDIEELPGVPPGRGRWPYTEWEKIPPGQALEITHLIRNDETIAVMATNLQGTLRQGRDKRIDGLYATRRKNRVFICRKAPAS